MKTNLRRIAIALMAAAVVGCGGGREADGEVSEGGDIGITPDPLAVAQGSRQVVRVDVFGAGGEAPAAYEFDLDEQLSGIDVTTAPCPASLDRPACQDWTFAPSLDAVPGEYLVSVRTVGLATGIAKGHFALRVLAANAAYGAAEDVVSSTGTTLVIAGGRLYSSGENRDAALGVGYLQRDFSADGSFRSAEPHPLRTDAFVPVRGVDDLRFVGAALGSSAFAVDDRGDVLYWGNRRGNPAGDGVTPGTEHALRPTRVGTLPEYSVAVASAGGHHHALSRFGTLRTWSSSDAAPRQLTTHGGATIRNARAIAAAGQTLIALMDDGTVRENGVDPKPGLPGGIVAVAAGYNSNNSGPGWIALAVGGDGSVWWWAPGSAQHDTPRRETAVTDATAVSVADGFLLALRAGDPGLSVWQFGDEVARSIAPPAGSAFVRIGGGFAITNDCGPRSGSLWRVASIEPLRVRAVHEFGSGGNCGEVRADTSPVAVTVSGAGRVVSDPPGIDCLEASTCEHAFRQVAHVRLNLVAQPGWELERFDCTPEPGLTTVDNVTVVEPGRTRSCAFRFVPDRPRELRLTVRRSGSGEVTSMPDGIVCGAACSYWFGRADDVVLSARPARGFRFDGFSGDPGCSEGRVLMTAATVCEARFAELPPPSAPVDLRVTIVSRSSIGLGWEAASGVIDGYRLERSIAGGAFVVLRSLDAAGRIFLDTNLAPNVAHTYRLTAFGPNGDGAPATLTVTTPPSDPPPPAPPSTPSAGQWRQFGAALPNSAAAPAIALDSQHRPIVATVERDAGGVGRLRVRRWQIETWADLGTLNATAILDAAYPALLVDALDRPIVAWTQLVPDGEHLMAMRFDGMSWQPLCGEPVTCALNFGLSVPARRASLALDATGQPVAAWIELGAASLKRFDGTTWQVLPAGRGPAAAGVVSRVRVAIGGGNAVHVAWLSDGASDFVGVARADASAWTHLGGPLSGSEPAGDLSVREIGLGVGAAGVPTVAWVQGGFPGARVYARQWDGVAWIGLGGGVAASSDVPYEGFAFRLSVEGIPYVALSTFSLAGVGRLGVVRLLGASWDSVSTFDARLSDLALAMPQTGATTSPHLVWLRAGGAETWRWTPP